MIPDFGFIFLKDLLKIKVFFARNVIVDSNFPGVDVNVDKVSPRKRNIEF
jgi:hypothetical protein